MKLKLKFAGKEELMKLLDETVEKTTVDLSALAVEMMKAIKQGQFGSVKTSGAAQMQQLHTMSKLYLHLVYPTGGGFVEQDGIDSVYFGPEPLVPERISQEINAHIEELQRIAPTIQPGGMGGGRNPFGPTGLF